jgi:hypothetical protein
LYRHLNFQSFKHFKNFSLRFFFFFVKKKKKKRKEKWLKNPIVFFGELLQKLFFAFYSFKTKRLQKKQKL